MAHSKNTRNFVLIGCSALAMAISSTGALAQDAEEKDEGVIIVTAQKREQNIQDVPASVTAATGEQLESLNATDVADLEFFAPGLLWGEGGSAQWPTLRGVNTAINLNVGDPSIAFFINGVYKSRTGQALAAAVDVERVEVLRGPQGTLFGRNATAGAINVISRKPTNDFEYSLSALGGSFDTIELNGMVNVPVSDTFAMRLAAYYERRDGYVENIGPGPDLLDEDVFYGRASFAWNPTDEFEANLRVALLERDRVGGGGFTFDVIGQNFDPVRGVRSVFGEAVSINPRFGDGIDDIVGGVNVGDIGVPVVPGEYVVSQDFMSSEDTSSFDIDLELSYDFGPFTIRSITSYADFSSVPEGDNDFQSDPTLRNDSAILSAAAETFTQEFQLISQPGDTIEYVLGAYYLNDKTFENFSVNNENGVFGPVPNRAGMMTTRAFDKDADVDTESYAFYGQATVNLTDALSITGGLRYTRDTKTFRLREAGWLGGAPFNFNPDLDTERSFDKLTWRIGAEYDISDQNLIYGSVSTGFRSGGFNVFAEAGSSDADSFESEQITSYEIGSKNTFAGGDATINLAAFYSKLTDQQVSTVVSIAGTGFAGFDNAGETEIFGFEVEARADLTDNWFAYGTLAYTNSEYQRYLAAGFAGDVLGAPGVIADPMTGNPVVDLAGNRVERAPRWRGTLLTGYNFDLGGSGTITPLISFAYTSSYFNTQFNTPILFQDSYTKTDLRITYTNESESFSIEGFVENIEDEAVLNRGTFGGSNAAFANYAPPRTWGVRLRIQN